MKNKLIIAALSFSLFTQGVALAEGNTPPKVNWIEGPKVVDVGKIASLDLNKDFVFLNSDDTKTYFKEVFHDTSTDREIGAVFPRDEKQNWTVLFEYDESGHIKDDEKKGIDADSLLKSLRDGTEENNKSKPAAEQVHVTGWDLKPFYDDKTHNLTWSVKGEDAQKQTFLNYDVRLLTRTGYISAVLISDPKNLEQDKQILTQQILPKLSVKQGQRYEDFDSTKDKLSEYGLTALILGGAGVAVAKKVGIIAMLLLFLKKAGVIIVAAALGAWRWLKKKKDRDKNNQPPGLSQQPTETEEEPQNKVL